MSYENEGKGYMSISCAECKKEIRPTRFCKCPQRKKDGSWSPTLGFFKNLLKEDPQR